MTNLVGKHPVLVTHSDSGEKSNLENGSATGICIDGIASLPKSTDATSPISKKRKVNDSG